MTEELIYETLRDGTHMRQHSRPNERHTQAVDLGFGPLAFAQGAWWINTTEDDGKTGGWRAAL